MGKVIQLAERRPDVCVMLDLVAYAERVRELTRATFREDGTLPERWREEPRAQAVAVLLAAGWLLGQDEMTEAEKEELVYESVQFLFDGMAFAKPGPASPPKAAP